MTKLVSFIIQMPPKKKSSQVTKRKSQRGKGITDSIAAALNFIKDRHLISEGLSYIPTPLGQIGSKIATQIGLGMRKGRTRK